MRDVKSMNDFVTSIAPAAITATTSGSSVDLRGYQGAQAVIVAGTITDGTHTPKLQESDDGSSWSDVAASDLQGAFAGLASDTVQRVGYLGGKRFVRAVSTVTGATAGGVYAAIIHRARPEQAPV